jgi:prepilin-type N-terminal cleavage/methylation domain-containing protein
MKELLKTIRSTKGFTLTEVLVGVLVLSTAIVSASNLLVSMIRSNAANMHYLQAYYYTQESMEAFRNMRDTHFMHNLDFCGKEEFDLFGKPGSFKKGCSDDDGVDYSVNLVANPFEGAWTLAEGSFGYLVHLQKSGLVEPTVFDRVCKVSKYEEDLPDDGADYAGKAALVTCRTTWEEYSKEREVSLSMILTDWHSE